VIIMASVIGVTFVAPVFGADPTASDCVTANENSISLRSQHKLLVARSESLVCASPSCPADIRNECARRVADVIAAIPTILVTMDGKPLADRLEGTALSLDPGLHTFVFDAQGQPPLTKQFVIQEGVKDRRERIVLGAEAIASTAGAPGAAPGATLATAAAQPVAGSAQAPAGISPDAGPVGGTQRIIGWTGAGLGVVGLGLGVFFEVKSSSKVSDRDAICPSGTGCPPGSQANIDALTDDARSAATLGAVSLVAGGLLLAGGLALVFTAPRTSDSAAVAVAPVLAPGFRGAALTGRIW
jgi:hypothetical protein